MASCRKAIHHAGGLEQAPLATARSDEFHMYADDCRATTVLQLLQPDVPIFDRIFVIMQDNAARADRIRVALSSLL